MSLQSLLDEQAALTVKARQEITRLEGEINSRQDLIREIKAKFPGVKAEPAKRKPGRSPKSLGAPKRISSETLLEIGEGALQYRDQLGEEFTIKDVKAHLGDISVERIRTAFDKLNTLEVLRLVKPQNGPYPAVWGFYPNSSVDLLYTRVQKDGNDAS